MVQNDERIKGALSVAKELGLMSPEGRADTLGKCKHDQLNVKCTDDRTDICANGHIHYGLITLFILFAPGIIFGFSEFMHFKVN